MASCSSSSVALVCQLDALLVGKSVEWTDCIQALRLVSLCPLRADGSAQSRILPRAISRGCPCLHFSALTFVLAPLPNAVCSRCAGADDISPEYNSAYTDFGRFLTGMLVVSTLRNRHNGSRQMAVLFLGWS